MYRGQGSGSSSAIRRISRARTLKRSMPPCVREHEPRLALDGGADGLDFYRVICEKWRDVLCENGMLFFEVGIGQADSVLRIMRSSGFGDIQIVKDLNNIPRVVYGTRVETI